MRIVYCEFRIWSELYGIVSWVYCYVLTTVYAFSSFMYSNLIWNLLHWAEGQQACKKKIHTTNQTMPAYAFFPVGIFCASVELISTLSIKPWKTSVNFTLRTWLPSVLSYSLAVNTFYLYYHLNLIIIVQLISTEVN